jgi:hypothetical protein
MRPAAFHCVLAALAASVSSVAAQSNPSQHHQGPAIGLTASTLGLGAEVSVKPIGNVVIRLNGSWMDLKYNKDLDDAAYSGSVKAISAGLIGDWHPFANGFRLSGGARILNGEFSASASGSSVSIGGRTYTAAEYGTLNLSAKNANAIAPYIGIGFDNAHFTPGNWFFALDVGALFTGTAKIGLSATGNVPGLAADIEAERQKLVDEFGKFTRFVPVIQLAAKYRF